MPEAPLLCIRPLVQPATGSEALALIPPPHSTSSELALAPQEWAAALSLLTSLFALLLLLLLPPGPGRRWLQ